MADNSSTQNPNEVNKQIVDSVITINESVLGQSSIEAVSLGMESLAHSLSLIMHNAGSAQYGAQQLSQAVVSATCAEIIAAGK